MQTKTTTKLSPFVGQHVTIRREAGGGRVAMFRGTVLSAFMLDDDCCGETGFSDQGVVSIVPTLELRELETRKSWEGRYVTFEASDGRRVSTWTGRGPSVLVWVEGSYAGSFDLPPVEAARASLDVR